MFDFTLNAQALPAQPPSQALFSATPTMPDLSDKRAWQRHTMARLYDLSLAEDAKISLSALEKIAKTSVADLMSPTVQINYQAKTTEELETTLLEKINRILGTNTQPAIDAEYSAA